MGGDVGRVWGRGVVWRKKRLDSCSDHHNSEENTNWLCLDIIMDMIPDFCLNLDVWREYWCILTSVSSYCMHSTGDFIGDLQVLPVRHW